MAQREVSGEDLRERLFQTFQDRGVLESMKSILRKKLVTELQASGNISLSLGRNAKLSESSLFVRAANSIIADHLKQFGYEYTRAVFLPESGLSVSKPMTIREILCLLHVEPTSTLYKSLMSFQPEPGVKGSLWEFIVQLVLLYSGSQTSIGTQTDEFQYPPGMPVVDQEIAHLQRLFAEDLDRHKMAETERVQDEARMARRQSERSKAQQMEQEMQNFRRVELQHMRLQEKEKWLREISVLREYQKSELARQKAEDREKWEREIHRAQEQINALREKEMEMERQLKRYQEILQTSDQAKERPPEKSEIAANSGDPLTNYALIVDTATEPPKSKEAELAEMEGRYEEKLRIEMERYRRQIEVEFQRKVQDLERKEASFREAKERFDNECESKKLAEVVPLQVNLDTSDSASLRHQNEVLTKQLEEMKDYRELQASKQTLSSLVQSLRHQLSEKTKDSVEQQAEYEKVIKEMSENSAKLNSELTELNLEVAMVTEQSEGFRNSSEENADKLQQERLANQMLRVLYDEQLRQQADLMKEFEHFQTAMGIEQETVSGDELSRPTHGAGRRSTQVPAEEPSGVLTAAEGEDVTDEESSLGAPVVASKEMLERMDKQAQELDVTFARFMAGVTGTSNYLASGDGFVLTRLTNAFRNTPAVPPIGRERVRVVRDFPMTDRPVAVNSQFDSTCETLTGGFVPLAQDCVFRDSTVTGPATPGVMTSSAYDGTDGGVVTAVGLAHGPIDIVSAVRRGPVNCDKAVLSDRIDSGSAVPQARSDSVSVVPHSPIDNGSTAPHVGADTASRSPRISSHPTDHAVAASAMSSTSITRGSVSGINRAAGSLTDDVSANRRLPADAVSRESVARSSVLGVDRPTDLLPDNFLSERFLSPNVVPRESTTSGFSGADRPAGEYFAFDHRLSDDTIPRESTARGSVSGVDRAAGSLTDIFSPAYRFSADAAPRDSATRGSLSGPGVFFSDQYLNPTGAFSRDSIARASVSGSDKAADITSDGFLSERFLTHNAASRETVARTSMSGTGSAAGEDSSFVHCDSVARGSLSGVDRAAGKDLSSVRRESAVRGSLSGIGGSADEDLSTVRRDSIARGSLSGVDRTAGEDLTSVCRDSAARGSLSGVGGSAGEDLSSVRRDSIARGSLSGVDRTAGGDLTSVRRDSTARGSLSGVGGSAGEDLSSVRRDSIARGSLSVVGRAAGEDSSAVRRDSIERGSVSGSDKAADITTDGFLSERFLNRNAASRETVTGTSAGSMTNGSRVSSSHTTALDGTASCLPDAFLAEGLGDSDSNWLVAGAGCAERGSPLAYRSSGHNSAIAAEARYSPGTTNTSYRDEGSFPRPGDVAKDTRSSVTPVSSRGSVGSAGREHGGLRGRGSLEKSDHVTQEEREKDVDQQLLEEIKSQEDEVRTRLDLEDLEDDGFTWRQKSQTTAASEHDQSERSSEQREVQGVQDSGQEDDDQHLTGYDKDDIESFYPDRLDASSEASW